MVLSVAIWLLKSEPPVPFPGRLSVSEPADEAGRAVIQYAAEVLKVQSLFAGRHPANDASGRVLTKLGFERTGEEFYGPTKLLHHTYHLSM